MRIEIKEEKGDLMLVFKALLLDGQATVHSIQGPYLHPAIVDDEWRALMAQELRRRMLIWMHEMLQGLAYGLAKEDTDVPENRSRPA